MERLPESMPSPWFGDMVKDNISAVAPSIDQERWPVEGVIPFAVVVVDDDDDSDDEGRNDDGGDDGDDGEDPWRTSSDGRRDRRLAATRLTSNRLEQPSSICLRNCKQVERKIKKDGNNDKRD